MNYLAEFIADFVSPIHRSRLYYLLSKHHRQDEFIGHFYYDDYLDARYFHEIAPRDQNPDVIYYLMQKMGAPQKCFAISIFKPFGEEVALLDALQETVLLNRAATFILSQSKSRARYLQSSGKATSSPKGLKIEIAKHFCGAPIFCIK